MRVLPKAGGPMPSRLLSVTFSADPNAVSTLSHLDPGVFGRVGVSALTRVATRERMGAVVNFVPSVGRAGTPPQIAQRVVEFVAIIVAAFVTGWAGANERRQHEPVNVDAGTLDVVPAIPVSINVAVQSLLGDQPLDLARIRNLVAGKSRYVFPLHGFNHILEGGRLVCASTS
jgi:hypothetical protein